MSRAKVPIAGSDRPTNEGEPLGKAEARRRTTVSVYLRNPSSPRHSQGSAADFEVALQRTTRRRIARQRAEEYAPAAAALRRFAAAHDLTVRKVDLTGRRVVLSGTLEQLMQSFGATMRFHQWGGKRLLTRVGPLLVPKTVAPWTRAVLGLDHQLLELSPRSVGDSLAQPNEGLWPNEVATLYGIPPDLEAAGQTVGIIALGGGYLPSDVIEACRRMGCPAAPAVVNLSVGGATNQYGGGTSFDEELALDLQVVAGTARGARIVIYFAGNRVENIAAALHQALFATAERPQVITLSWGSAEKFWHDDVREATQAALRDAVRLNVAVVAAAGDDLATGGVPDGEAHVFFPASSPYVLACGGTRALLGDAGILSEEVWNEGQIGTGGGISDVFPVPAYQEGLLLPPSINGTAGRGVPDVSAAAAAMPGYRVVLGGREIVKDGTSAVAPFWAGLITLANEQRTRPVGMIHSLLYSNPAAFRSVTAGNNRIDGIGYDAGPGWNACTGLGTPRAADIISIVAQAF